MRIVDLAVPALTLAFAGAASAQVEAAAKPAGPTDHPALKQALHRAAVHNTPVLAVLVDEGHDLVADWRKDRNLRVPVRYEFEIVQFAGKAADKLAVQLKFPAAMNSKPALIVLGADGKVRERFETSAFTTDGVVDSKKLIGQLTEHHCEPIDAELKLKAALVEAKKTGRNVFIRFDAPW